jgi:hypothetical protein
MRLAYWIVSSSRFPGAFGRSLSRVVLSIAARIVPEERRGHWRDEWCGNFWHWMLKAAGTNDPDARRALLDHTRDAARAAWAARFETDSGSAQVSNFLGHPQLPLLAGLAALAIIALASGGFSATRHLAARLSYTDPSRLVVLAQGPPVFGMRLGFREVETELFRRKSQTLSGMAAYSWHNGTILTQRGNRSIRLANVDPSFFEVLGVATPISRLAGDEFFVSSDFWHGALRADPNLKGRAYIVDGRPMRLAGVLPANFEFLSAPIAVWTSRPEPTPSPLLPRRLWWVNLRGIVARLAPGVMPSAAVRELRGLQIRFSLARPNYVVQATPIEYLAYRNLQSYTWYLMSLLTALLLLAAARTVIDTRRGLPPRRSARYWGYFALKTALPLAALYFAILEFTPATELGLTGGDATRGAPVLLWTSFASVVVIAIWAWRDQSRRCRVCLQRMRSPLRIGVRGQVLLEAAGDEVMCPNGHGTVYHAASVLGSDLSNRWMGLDLNFDADPDPSEPLADPNGRRP